MSSGPGEIADPNFMLSLARGLSVLRAFEGRSAMSAATVAKLVGLPRPSAMRCLHTLQRLGYLAAEDGSYSLTTATLPLGYAFLGSSAMASAAGPVLNDLRDRLGESVSLAMLDATDFGRVVYVARAETVRIISAPLMVGSTLPSHCTSNGRVLLALLDDAAREAFLDRAPFPRRTPRTLVDAAPLRAKLERIARQGYALIDEELEAGLRSIAVPVISQRSGVAAALNAGAQSRSRSCESLRTEILPELQAAAAHIARVS